MVTSRETIGGTGEDPQGRAERALVKVFLSMRAYHLVAAGMSMSLDRKRYRRPGLATALLAASVGESAWLTWRHLLCRRPLDSTAMLVDTVVNGSTVAAWMSGMPFREAASLGILMNTRGLMELVILNIGLDIKIISPALFSMMVIMALVTTFMTTPVLNLICPKEMLQGEKVGSERVAAAEVSLQETGVA